MLTKLGSFGARARPLNLNLTENVLIIGLGQVGLQAVASVEEMLRATLPPREMREQIRLLGIAEWRSIQQEQILPRESRLLLSIDPIVWSDVPGRYATYGVARWWPRTPNNPNLQADPSLARPFGRLLLWANAQLVGEKLYQMMTWLQQSSQRTNRPARIIILSSLAEPEGSSMIVDITGRLRLLSTEDLPIVGIFTAASSAEDEEGLLLSMASTYATLKELDALSLQPEVYPHEMPFAGVSGNPQNMIPYRVLDYICMTGDAHRTIPNPEEAVAEFAITWLLSRFDTPDQKLDLLPLPTQNSLDRYTGYTMFGVAKLGLPVRSVLELQAISIARNLLEGLGQPYPDSVDSWANKIIARGHTDLLSKGLVEHHLLIDKLRELRRRLHSNQLSASAAKASRSARRDIIREAGLAEWRRLLRENETEELDRHGAVIARDVLRRRIDDALAEGLRAMTDSLGNVIVTLAYSEGRGLHWTHKLFEELGRQVDAALLKVRERIDNARIETDNLREEWLDNAGARDMEQFDRLGVDMLHGFTNWIGWEARYAAWVELRTVVDSMRDRLATIMEQLPAELKRLTAIEDALNNELEDIYRQGPGFPAGAIYTDNWIRAGLQSMGTLEETNADQLIARVFERWNGRQLEALVQVARFPREVLDATRLTIQPQARFPNLHDFVSEQGGLPAVVNAFQGVRSSADPIWVKGVAPPTGRLDEPFTPPIAFEIVREAPRQFTILPPIENSRAGYQNVPSPDPDEITVIRVMHGWAAEYIHPLKINYRRAYQRIGSENVPLHIDRRWETTMSDLMHTTVRSEVSNLWEATLQATYGKPRDFLPGVQPLANMLFRALDTEGSLQMMPSTAPDIFMFLFPLQPSRLKIPPPLCTFIFIMARRGTREVMEDLLQTVSAAVLDESFCFVVNVSGRPDIDELLRPLREQSILPLELTESDVKHIMSAPKPMSALRDIVIDRIRLTAISPFYTRAPVPDHMFFGREKEIADVRSKLATHSVVLIGGRRIGKTSMLQKIKRALEAADSSIVPYYLDCSNVLKHAHFFRRIQRDWRVDIPTSSDPVEFDEVVEALAHRHGGHTPVFLLDEVDRLLKTDQANEYDEPLFRTFRSLSNEKRCQFVFSGEKLLLGSIRNAHSVLFNFPKDVRLAPLSLEVVRRLVTEPFEMLNIWLENADELIQEIYQISAGHPNIVQTICHALVSIIDQDKGANLLRRIHLGQALDIHQVQVDIVETIWGQMHPVAKLVTLIWPENARQMTLEEMRMLIQSNGRNNILTQEVKNWVIPDLELYNFVRQVGQEYYLIPVYFPTILDFMTDKRMEIQAILEKP